MASTIFDWSGRGHKAFWPVVKESYDKAYPLKSPTGWHTVVASPDSGEPWTQTDNTGGHNK